MSLNVDEHSKKLATARRRETLVNNLTAIPAALVLLVLVPALVLDEELKSVLIASGYLDEDFPFSLKALAIFFISVLTPVFWVWYWFVSRKLASEPDDKDT